MSEDRLPLPISPLEGLLAGAIAGVVMSIFMVLWDALAGDGIWSMPQLIPPSSLGQMPTEAASDLCRGRFWLGLRYTN